MKNFDLLSKRQQDIFNTLVDTFKTFSIDIHDNKDFVIEMKGCRPKCEQNSEVRICSKADTYKVEIIGKYDGDIEIVLYYYVEECFIKAFFPYKRLNCSLVVQTFIGFINGA